MKELSLFTGMGGGIYGSLILGWETLAYVEQNEYCQTIIKQRQSDGWFDKGDIYGDIAEFNKNTLKNTQEKSTLSPEDFHVSRLAWLENARAQVMTAGSSMKLLRRLRLYNQEGYF